MKGRRETMATLTANIQARIAPDFKEELLMAAEVEGMSLTDYLVRNLKPCVEKTLQRDRIWKLAEDESARFSEALMRKKPRSNPKLKKAAERYRELGLDK